MFFLRKTIACRLLSVRFQDGVSVEAPPCHVVYKEVMTDSSVDVSKNCLEHTSLHPVWLAPGLCNGNGLWVLSNPDIFGNTTRMRTVQRENCAKVNIKLAKYLSRDAVQWTESLFNCVICYFCILLCVLDRLHPCSSSQAVTDFPQPDQRNRHSRGWKAGQLHTLFGNDNGRCVASMIYIYIWLLHCCNY